MAKKNVTKKKTEQKKKKTRGQAILYSLLLLFCIGVIAVCIAGTAFFVYIASSAPPFESKKLYTVEPSVIYDIKGNVIANIGTQDRVLLTYDEIPEVLINAIVATEDARFFQHNGIDLPRFLIASAKQVAGKGGGGASTLTMQLSKNVYTSKTDTGWEGIKRKFTDVYLAVFKIEPSYSKEEILEFYVNSFFMGNGYGVEVASKNYFGKSAKDLNLSEAAMIAGLFQAPGAYNPYTNPEATEERRQTVLYLMHRHGYISDTEYEIAMDMTVDKIVQENNNADIGSGIVNPDYQLFVDMVIKSVKDKTGNNPYTTSMSIYTTLDPDAQKHVSDIMNGKTYKWQNSKVQAGVAVVDIETGAISAIGGGRNVNAANTLNRAINLNKQIGSTAKPLYDYGPAIEYLNWNTATVIGDTKTTYSDGTSINNWDGGYIGYNTIQTHLIQSRNIPALKTFKSVNKADIIKFVTNLGLDPEIANGTIHEAHSIGGYNGESPLSMANAYAAFGNGGYYNEPYNFTKVVYNDSGDTYINKTETRQAMSDSTAYMVTSMLQATASYGIDSGSYKSVNGLKYAAKTGTTNFDDDTKKKYHMSGNAVNDYWVVGFNNQYSIAVWYGYDKITDGYNKLGSSQHQRLFQAVAKGIFKKGTDKFEKPDSVVEVTVETDSSGLLLPSANTPNKYKTKALFVAGTEPNKISTRFDKLKDVSNLDATNNNDGTATVTWSGIPTPNALNKSYITGIFQSSKNIDAAGYANYVYKKNIGLFGNLGYNVYLEKDGTLELQGWTDQTSYTITAPNGDNKIVVKAAYSKYQSNMSSGKSVNVNITGSSFLPPIVDGGEDGNNGNNGNNGNSGNNGNKPNN